jgi:hypothetical protein
VISLLFALALVQGSGPSLEATVDEERVSVGEDLLYTLRAVSHSPLPMHVSIAPFTGLEIVSRSERSEVSMGHDPTRTTVLEVRLRAVRPGRWQLGPARAVQGRDTVEAPAVVVDVTASRDATASTLSPRLRRLLDQARPPVPGQAAVDLIVSADSVRVGEQVDVVTAAWFPRDLRLQLRRPPTLQPPVIDGVWSYPQATPAGIAATRSIGGRWYDLFVAHQVVFPLLPGTVVVPRATLKYSTPVALQFFSQEERYALSSKAETLAVAALPEAGRPVPFSGAIGTGLTLERQVSPRVAKVGEGVMVELALSGEGNTALWPAPDLQWAPGTRAYSDKVEEREGRRDQDVPVSRRPRLGRGAGAAGRRLPLLRPGRGSLPHRRVGPDGDPGESRRRPDDLHGTAPAAHAPGGARARLAAGAGGARLAMAAGAGHASAPGRVA